MSTEEWATISAYQQEVIELQTEVAVLATFVPTAAVSTPTPPFAEAWSVAITGVTRAESYPNSSVEAGATPTVAHGIFLAVRLEVFNDRLQPVRQFPWWSLRLQDPQGRTFTPQVDVTASYFAAAAIARPNDYQPGIAYDEAVVFDVPPDASGLTLVSADGTLRLDLPAAEAIGTPPA